ncbi:MAG: fumarylacetoacetate hydrolase family protein [Rhodocyclaceae bacterium]|nr:fumarylacetoacetate hydrolase family protein [Rhodocyclaceae bacterium]
MKLASLNRGGRDGTLAVVSRDLTRCQTVPEIARTLQAALDDWPRCAPRLTEVACHLEAAHARHAEPFDPATCLAPLPRAYQWLDGSAYLNHVRLARQARGAALPPDLEAIPLMYQGGSDDLAGPCRPLRADPAWGLDFEAELAVITGDVPAGMDADGGLDAVRLLMLANDVSLRHLVPAELARGFGFVQSKPSTSFSPVAITPDELGDAWQGGRVHREMRVDLNGKPFARVPAGDGMHCPFGALIAHAARTRRLGAGTIVGSGTVSLAQNGLEASRVERGGQGCCCLLERRLLEQIELGHAKTPYLAEGDRVRIEMLDGLGLSLFGAIDQGVVNGNGRGNPRPSAKPKT